MESSLKILQPSPSEAEKITSQLSKQQQSQLHHQGYRLVGNHSAVKTCEWTRNSLRGSGACYKFAFYGIRSHQCLQMTTSMFCASRCKFCWRGQKAPVSEEWYGSVDSPEHIINHAMDEHLKLLIGFRGMGYEKAAQDKIAEMDDIRHVALSLTGEPITYPLINQILESFHKRRISTFLVTNAQYPESIEKIKNITQLYLSIDAPNKEMLKRIDNPLLPDFWERMIKSLDLLKTRKYRTCIRLTMIRDENMDNEEQYAKLIRRGLPDVIELKSYVHVGESRRFYSQQNMPTLDDMKVFMNRLLTFLPDYEFIRQHIPSRAILLIRKDLKKKAWINFPKFFDLIEEGKTPETEEYSSTVMTGN